MKGNIILIGMPGVGKSTAGVILAKILGHRFIDTDIVIQNETGKLLSEIIQEKGIDGFIQTENEIVSRLDADRAVIATGGSVVYSSEAMKHLSEIGTVIYLSLDYRTLKNRLGNIKSRGVVIRSGQKLSELYSERSPLYEKYADIIIDENNCGIEKTVSNILSALNKPENP